VSKLIEYNSDSGFHYSNDILFECGIDRKGILGVCLSACLSVCLATQKMYAFGFDCVALL
jgi:hypothetical protein